MNGPRGLLAALLLAAACGAKPASRADDPAAGSAVVEAVVRGDLRERILLTGELVAERADRLTVPMTRLWQLSIRWLAEDGSEVAEGDRLVEFDDSALLSEVEQKRLKLKQALSERAAQQATDAIALADKQFELARQRTRTRTGGHRRSRSR